MSAAGWVMVAGAVGLVGVVVFAWHWVVLAAFGWVVLHELRRRRDTLDRRGR